jgi:MFS family permease
LVIVCGLPAGAIMSLPARVLDQKMRPIGMGLFYTVYYAGMLAGPAIGGRLSTSAGSARAALDFGAVVLLACPVVLWLFRASLPADRFSVRIAAMMTRCFAPTSQIDFVKSARCGAVGQAIEKTVPGLLCMGLFSRF